MGRPQTISLGSERHGDGEVKGDQQMHCEIEETIIASIDFLPLNKKGSTHKSGILC